MYWSHVPCNHNIALPKLQTGLSIVWDMTNERNGRLGLYKMFVENISALGTRVMGRLASDRKSL